MHGVILEKIESTSFSAKNIDLSTEILRTIYIASTFFVPLYYPLLALFLPWRALLCDVAYVIVVVVYLTFSFEAVMLQDWCFIGSVWFSLEKGKQSMQNLAENGSVFCSCRQNICFKSCYWRGSHLNSVW